MPARPEPADPADPTPGPGGTGDLSWAAGADPDGAVVPEAVLAGEADGPILEVGPSGEAEWERPVRTYLWQSLVATLLCCLPTGVIALVYASITQNRLQAGDVPGARQASARARRWCVISMIAFVAVLLTYVVAVVILVAVAGDRT
ncbi:CD225/dispanin family protein [Frankia sp. R82]|uniref:CD225/dispanin family protein n=1 Tax=Frankia sp. R82 TaxID=2950553 RepID=UPI002042EC45|nr:CD225/dispanin family protein [Frankia sp. R82]MCM3886233.1 CD225/dispanin family protein [Frankia sp. R82]